MDYPKRLINLQNFLKANACDALLIEDQTNLYYLTGLDLSAGKMLIHLHGATLYVDGRYFEACKKDSPIPVHLLEPKTFEIEFSKPEFAWIKTLGFDNQTTTYKSFELLDKFVKTVNKNRTEKLTLIPLDSPLQALRMIKEEGEIALLKQAADLGSAGFDYVCSLLQEGISEEELALELEIFWKRRGGKKVAFDPIIAFGENGSMPHYRAGKKRLKIGDAVLIDIGVNLNHYHSDMTRMAFYGTPHPELLKIHTIVKQAQQAALELCCPDTTVGALDLAARDLIGKAGYGENFPHSLGHGVGLDIHESPTIRNTAGLSHVKLVPGMVITIEPGIYVPGLGGVRIEDTVLITKNGHENLTNRSHEPVIVNIARQKQH